MLEREGLPYLQKPYHLHDFLEKVSELLVESGAIAEPMRWYRRIRQRRRGAGGQVRASRDTRRSDNVRFPRGLSDDRRRNG